MLRFNAVYAIPRMRPIWTCIHNIVLGRFSSFFFSIIQHPSVIAAVVARARRAVLCICRIHRINETRGAPIRRPNMSLYHLLCSATLWRSLVFEIACYGMAHMALPYAHVAFIVISTSSGFPCLYFIWSFSSFCTASLGSSIALHINEFRFTFDVCKANRFFMWRKFHLDNTRFRLPIIRCTPHQPIAMAHISF